MPSTLSELAPCGKEWSIDEQVQPVEKEAVYNDRSLTYKDDKKEDLEMKLKGQQVEEDEYTLSAFGDIPLSHICFLPGPLGALSPEKILNEAGSTMSSKIRPKVIKKIQPPSRPKAFVSAVDFKSIFNNLERRVKLQASVSASEPKTIEPSGYQARIFGSARTTTLLQFQLPQRLRGT